MTTSIHSIYTNIHEIFAVSIKSIEKCANGFLEMRMKEQIKKSVGEREQTCEKDMNKTTCDNFNLHHVRKDLSMAY